MKRYIDCDGIILNTEEGLFDEYYRLKENNPNYKRLHYLQTMDWEKWIEQAKFIGDAYEVLMAYDPSKADILTKVHSLNEAKVKIRFFKREGIKNNVIIVPYGISKTEVVIAKGNILVDDSQGNLDEWNLAGGHAFYMGNKDIVYPKIETLDDIMDDEKVKKLIVSR